MHRTDQSWIYFQHAFEFTLFFSHSLFALQILWCVNYSFLEMVKDVRLDLHEKFLGFLPPLGMVR
jgi:hypothetical protein